MCLANELQINKHLLMAILAFFVIIGLIGYSFLTKGNSAPIKEGSIGLQPYDSQGSKTSEGSFYDASGTTSSSTIQDIYIRANSDGSYDKNSVTIKYGMLTRLHFTADSNAGCGRQFVIYGLNVQTTSSNGQEQVVEFTPKTPGTYTYSCGMRMWGPGTLIVQ